MKYEKKMIILTGEYGEKGTLKVERSAYGLTAVLNCYNYRKATVGEFTLALKSDNYIKLIPLGRDITFIDKIVLDDFIDIEDTHFIIINSDFVAVLYGTLCKKRIWYSNLLDGIKSEETKDAEKELTPLSENQEKKFAYSGREGIYSEVFPALPVGDYDDDAIAEVNYYPDNYADVGIENEKIIKSGMDSCDYARVFLGRASVQSVSTAAIKSSTMPFASSVDVYESKIKNLKNGMAKDLKNKPSRVVYNAADEKEIPPPDKDAAKKISGRRLSFYEQIQTQIEELFKKYPRFTDAEKLMPYTKWVKVDYENNGKYYAVGLVGDKPDFICYGVPDKYSAVPPPALDGYCQWFPLNQKQPQGDGLWLMYQDAYSGESVENIDI